MDPRYFNEIYELCGPIMKEAISNIILNDQVHDEPQEIITRCTAYLLSLNNEDFDSMYINMPTNLISFYNDETDKSTSDSYNYIDITYAIISHVELIHRCFAISDYNLIGAVKILPQISINRAGNFKLLNLESCKLLHEHGCSLSSLYSIASKQLNYESIGYLIDNISEIDYKDIYNDALHQIYNIYYILVLNKLKYDNNKITDLLFHSRIMKLNRIDDIIKCFYIIKVIPKADIPSYLINNLNLSDQKLELYNNLMDYYLKPRGSHTKAANTS
jgi:hypothetical protein